MAPVRTRSIGDCIVDVIEIVWRFHADIIEMEIL
jgi:hypothetical protein